MIVELKIKDISIESKSPRTFFIILSLDPHSADHHDLKNIVGTIKYMRIRNTINKDGIKSRINEKNITSEMKKRVPGNPRKMRRFISVNKKSLVLSKLIPLNSVISLDLYLRLIESTRRKKLVDRNAWLTSIQKPARNR